MRTLTIGIPSYQRRDSVVRLVSALDKMASSSPSSWTGVDVLVVLDGSTDGSLEALAALEPVLPRRVIWQENAGLAAARNQCLELAAGEIIWFLDDDLVPREGTVDTHRLAHEDDVTGVLLGPCLIPDEIPTPTSIRNWWANNYALLEEQGRVKSFDQFGIANASAPVSLLRSAGGFDETFKGYGWEDHELGARLLAAGVVESFEASAVAWHYTETDDHLAFRRERSIGRASVEMFRMHPELAAGYFTKNHRRRLVRMMYKSYIHTPRLLGVVAAVSFRLDLWLTRITGIQVAILRSVAWETAFFEGIAQVDREFLRWAMGGASGMDQAPSFSSVRGTPGPS